jgi:hypothetical protein
LDNLDCQFLRLLLSEYILFAWSSCDGANVGHTELHAMFGAYGKKKVD